MIIPISPRGMNKLYTNVNFQVNSPHRFGPNSFRVQGETDEIVKPNVSKSGFWISSPLLNFPCLEKKIKIIQYGRESKTIQLKCLHLPICRCVEGGRNQVFEIPSRNVKNDDGRTDDCNMTKNDSFERDRDGDNFEKNFVSSSTSSTSGGGNFNNMNSAEICRVGGSGRRANIVRQRYRKRPASFDTALIIHRSDNNSGQYVNCVLTSTPNQNPCSPLGRPHTQFWDVTSSSGCSSDSGSYLDSDSEVEDRLNEAFVKKREDCVEEDEDKDQITMSADEEAAFRLTVGRGHFSRSKKDRFLNHLRLEKRLNGLNNTVYGSNQLGHGRNLSRRYSGDLYRVTY